MSKPASALAVKSVQDFVRGRATLSQIYSDDELERVQIVRHGFPAKGMKAMSLKLHVPQGAVFDLLGVSRATADRLTKSGKNLNQSASERAMFIAGLVKSVENMIPDNGPDVRGFDAAKWVAQWLEQPQPALGGQTPGSFLDTADGRRIVRRLLRQMETGTYA